MKVQAPFLHRGVLECHLGSRIPELCPPSLPHCTMGYHCRVPFSLSTYKSQVLDSPVEVSPPTGCYRVQYEHLSMMCATSPVSAVGRTDSTLLYRDNGWHKVNHPRGVSSLRPSRGGLETTPLIAALASPILLVRPFSPIRDGATFSTSTRTHRHACGGKQSSTLCAR